MKIKALVSFSGLISMAEGEEIEYNNEEVIKDLLQAKYIEVTEGNIEGNEEIKEENEEVAEEVVDNEEVVEEVVDNEEVVEEEKKEIPQKKEEKKNEGKRNK